MRRQREREPQVTYQKILDVAKDLYTNVGSQKTTVSDIAQVLQMSPSNVYRFFSKKSDISQAVARQLLSADRQAMASVLVDDGTADAKLRRALRELKKAHLQRFVGCAKLHLLLEAAFDENWPVVDEHAAEVRSIIAAIIDEGQTAGEFEIADGMDYAAMVYNACLCFCHPQMVVKRRDGGWPPLDDVVTFCLRALRASSQAFFNLPRNGAPLSRPQGRTA